MEVKLRYQADDDVLDARFSACDPVRQVQLAAGVEATFDSDGYPCRLTIEHFSRFHNYVPLDDAIGIEGIAAVSQFQSDMLQGRRRRTVTLDLKPLSRRKLDRLAVA